MAVSPLAPLDTVPERVGAQYESKMAPNKSGQLGPMRFEEGIATDTDVPKDFSLGANQGFQTAPGRPNHNMNVYEKPASETMKERAHMGSAAWTDAPIYTGEFSHGANSVLAERAFEQVDRAAPFGRRWERHNPAQVND